MENYKIIESLAGTSIYEEKKILELVNGLKSNLNISHKCHDHQIIREKISNKSEFVDAQADKHN
jgi:hypothetical protein